MDKDQGAQVVSVAFIVPTLRRPEFLRKCLASIEAQSLKSANVLVGIRLDDPVSITVVNEFVDQIGVRSIEAKGIGVVGSMSSCLTEAKEEFIALVDDDVELPLHWLETMIGHLRQHTDVLAAAGRDSLQDYPEMRRKERRVNDVGTSHWYGRLTGNHHRGGGNPRRVDILRGSNCLFRGSFLREVGFETRLRGTGAQVNWELALAFQAMRRGMRFFYNPTIEVIHHAAPRLDRDVLHRGGFEERATGNNAFNETFVTKQWAPGIRRWTGLFYQIAIGSAHAPGVLHVVRQLLNRDKHIYARAVSTIKGRIQALLPLQAQPLPTVNHESYGDIAGPP